MKVIRNLEALPAAGLRTVVTIGNFDGVHLAHQELLRRVVKRANELQATPAAVTFDPHPIKVLAPQHAPKLITTLERKVELVSELGIELLLVLPFTRELAHVSPLEFVRGILVGRLGASEIHVGPNFRFGYRQEGDTEVLRELARDLGFGLQVLPIMKLRHQQVSSTRIRELIAAGNPGLAGRLLGRAFSIRGPIVAGLGVGRKHTVPTLNLAPIEELIPKVGVYVTTTRLGLDWHHSVTNVGFKPTFGEHHLTVESHLLEFSGPVKAADMEIGFWRRLRDEMKFQNPAILKQQIHDDARRAGKFFRLWEKFCLVIKERAATSSP